MDCHGLWLQRPIWEEVAVWGRSCAYLLAWCLLVYPVLMACKAGVGVSFCEAAIVSDLIFS